MRIPDVYPGSRIFSSRIPDPGSKRYGSQIRSRKNSSIFKYLIQNFLLGSENYDSGCLFRIPDPRSAIFCPIPDDGVKTAPDLGSQIRNTICKKPSMRMPAAFFNVSDLDPQWYCSPASRSNSNDIEKIKLNCSHNFSKIIYTIPSYLVR
jgi:hypothetical protein